MYPRPGEVTSFKSTILRSVCPPILVNLVNISQLCLCVTRFLSQVQRKLVNYVGVERRGNDAGAVNRTLHDHYQPSPAHLAQLRTEV